jgi:hypothetical protein
MSTSVISYDPERVAVLRRAALAVCDHLARAPLVDDPLAEAAESAVRLVQAHLEQGWLPTLARVASSRALIEPFGATRPGALLASFGFVRPAWKVPGPPHDLPVSWGTSNAEARSAGEAAVGAGEPGRFVGRTQTYEVIETPPSTTLPAGGHDPDGGSGSYDVIVEDHWFHEHNLAAPAAPYGATPIGPWIGWLARLARLAQPEPDVVARERGLAYEEMAVEARGPGGRGGVGADKNVAVGRLTTTDGDDVVIDYRAVSGKAERRGYVSIPAQPVFETDEDREYDTEVKILEQATMRLDPADDGVVEIFTELPPCSSCRGVMAQFHLRYPNVQVRVYCREEIETN